MRTIPYTPARIPADQALQISHQDLQIAQARRSVRHFPTDPVSQQLIENAIRIAGTAPNGAHRQPWHFVAISNPDLKAQIRTAAESEERDFYATKITDEWREALAPLGTDFVKTHLTDAPWLVVVFRQDYGLTPTGERIKNYYMTESVGIAVGFLIQALHRSGLATLTHTPAPMTFLREICQRPINEKPYVIIPVGYPAPDCEVPDLSRKSLAEIADFR